jgi:hypothetical protein
MPKVSPETVPETFIRPSGLFAFHALPIARRMVNVDAKRKEVRNKIQAMLDETSEAEWRKWNESLAKLLGGNETMLIRIGPESIFDLRSSADCRDACTH